MNSKNDQVGGRLLLRRRPPGTTTRTGSNIASRVEPSHGEARLVHTWRITFRPEPGWPRFIEDVDADELDIEARGVHMVLWRAQLVVGRVQRVIVWRLRRDEATIERVCSDRR
jgi:hypothetical protein